MKDKREELGKEFKQYLNQAREDFVQVAGKYSVDAHLELRTSIDSFLIAYDQARLQLIEAREEIAEYRKDKNLIDKDRSYKIQLSDASKKINELKQQLADWNKMYKEKEAECIELMFNDPNSDKRVEMLKQQLEEFEEVGWYFNGRLYKSLDELKGRTMSDLSYPVKAYKRNEQNQEG